MKKYNTMLYIWLLYGVRFIIGFQSAGYQYILLDIKNEFGLSNLLMAWITSAQLFSSMGIALVLSGIADKLNSRRLVCLSGSVYLLGHLINGFSNGPAMTVVAMLVSGAGANILNASMYPVLVKIDPAKTNRFTNMLQVYLCAGSFVAPITLALLMKGGMNWRGHYFIVAAAGAAAMAALACIKPQFADAALPEKKADAAKGSKFVFSPLFLLTGGSILLYMCAEAGMFGYVKQYFSLGLGDPVGAALSISLIRAAMMLGRVFAGQMNKIRTGSILLGFLFSGVCIFAMAVWRAKIPALIFCTLFGLAAAPVWPSVFSLGVQCSPEMPGRATNLMLLFNNTGNFVGNLTTGALTDAAGVGDAFYLVSAFAFAGMGAFFFRARMEKARRPR